MEGHSGSRMPKVGLAQIVFPRRGKESWCPFLLPSIPATQGILLSTPEFAGSRRCDTEGGPENLITCVRVFKCSSFYSCEVAC